MLFAYLDSVFILRKPAMSYNAYNDEKRKIIHIDMDSFFVSIELLDKPKLVDKPVAVGGQADKRGVISTSNYIARQYGVYSAMATSHALTLCPGLIVIYPNIEKYREISNNIKEIYYRFTDKVEPLSLDEAYLDVSSCSAYGGSATLIAIELKKLIYQQEKLTASAGVATNKFLAKVASDWNKPNGLFVVLPAQVDNFVKKLPVGKILGVGKVTAGKLENLGVFTCGDLQQYSLSRLEDTFGKFGSALFNFARGIDSRAVETTRTRKSLSVEETFAQDVLNHNVCLTTLLTLTNELTHRLEQTEHNGIHKLFVKVKFANFVSTTAERTHDRISVDVFQQLLLTRLTRNPTLPVRLLGVGVRFVETSWEQLMLPECDLIEDGL